MNPREGERRPSQEVEQSHPYDVGMERILMHGQIDRHEMRDLIKAGRTLPKPLDPSEVMHEALLHSLSWEAAAKDAAREAGVSWTDPSFYRKTLDAGFFRERLEKALPDPIPLREVREGLSLLREIRDKLPSQTPTSEDPR